MGALVRTGCVTRVLHLMAEVNPKSMHVSNWALASIRSLQKRVDQLERGNTLTGCGSSVPQTVKLAAAIPVPLRVEAPEFFPSVGAASFDLAANDCARERGHDEGSGDISPMQMWYADADVRLGVDPFQEVLEDLRETVSRLDVSFQEVSVEQCAAAVGGEIGLQPTLDASALEVDDPVDGTLQDLCTNTEGCETLTAEPRETESHDLIMKAIEQNDMSRVLGLVSGSKECKETFSKIYPFLAKDIDANIASRQQAILDCRRRLKVTNDRAQEGVSNYSRLHSLAGKSSTKRKLAQEMRQAEATAAESLKITKEAEADIDMYKAGLLTLLRLRHIFQESDCGLNGLD